MIDSSPFFEVTRPINFWHTLFVATFSMKECNSMRKAFRLFLLTCKSLVHTRSRFGVESFQWELLMPTSFFSAKPLFSFQKSFVFNNWSLIAFFSKKEVQKPKAFFGFGVRANSRLLKQFFQCLATRSSCEKNSPFSFVQSQ